MQASFRPFLANTRILPLVAALAGLGCGDPAATDQSDPEYSTLGQPIPCDDCAIGVVAGADHTCALLDDNSVRCWGGSALGQLGLGDTTTRGDGAGEMGANLPPVDLGTGRTATSLFSGYHHTCALLDSGKLKCWGSNGLGQLGLGDWDNRGDGASEMGDDLPPVALGTGRTATTLALGEGHTCARLDNGWVKCWGNNIYGQLGLGDTGYRGGFPGEMGNNLARVALGSGRTAIAIATGQDHSCALLDDQRVKCWGGNFYGGLGLGDTNPRGDEAGEMGDNLPIVRLGTGRTATAIAAGAFHACALLDNGKVKCWGGNFDGQLGLGDMNNRGDGAGEMGDNLNYAPLGSGRTAVAISAYGNRSCALLDNGKIKCWGSNSYGELGTGNLAIYGNGANEMGNNLPYAALGDGRTALAIGPGTRHTCVLLDNNRVKCWGRNHLGQLGRGSTADIGDGPGEMGDNLPTINLD